MAIREPQDLSSSLLPMSYFNWLIGMGFVAPPRSKRLHIMMTLYSVVFWVVYVFQFYVGISAMVPSYFYDNSPLAIIMYQILVYTNTCVSLLAPILAGLRYRAFKSYVARIERLDTIFEKTLGFEKNYKKIVLEQIYHILMICFIMLVITIADCLWLRSDTPFFTKIAVMLTFHHPMLLMLATDYTFCGATRALGKKFRILNIALLSLTEVDPASYTRSRVVVAEKKITKPGSSHRIGEAGSPMNRRYLFQTIRKTHLELSKLSERLNSVFGIQNLISMVVSSVMITGLLYTIYSAFYWEHTIHERIREVMPPAGWSIVYASKILMISHTAASVSDEAQKAGQIIYEVLGSANDKDFEKEIQEFALQMIQNPVQFSSCGFFTLDHTYVRGVIGSITTYLVILIQMSTSPTSSTSPTNSTAA